jgi:hypothetical protein
VMVNGALISRRTAATIAESSEANTTEGSSWPSQSGKISVMTLILRLARSDGTVT